MSMGSIDAVTMAPRTLNAADAQGRELNQNQQDVYKRQGLESNEERVRLGKPEVGSIFLDAYQDGNNVVIEVRDDGAGIDIDRVRQKAIEKGSITEKQAETMTDKDFIDLLFLPSFSTAEKITDVSDVYKRQDCVSLLGAYGF